MEHLRVNVPKLNDANGKLIKSREILPFLLSSIENRSANNNFSKADCFTGADAVNTLEAFLTENRENLGVRELFQILIRDKYVEIVGVDKDSKHNNSHIPDDQFVYRFTAADQTLDKIRKSSCRIDKDRSFNVLNSANDHHGGGGGAAPNLDRNFSLVLPSSVAKHYGSSRFSKQTASTSPRLKPTFQRKVLAACNFDPKQQQARFVSPVEEQSNVEESMDYCNENENIVHQSNDVISVSFDSTANHSVFSENQADLNDADYNLIYDLALFRLLTIIDIPILDAILRYKDSKDDCNLSGQSSPSNFFETIFAKFSTNLNQDSENMHKSFDEHEIKRLEENIKLLNDANISTAFEYLKLICPSMMLSQLFEDLPVCGAPLLDNFKRKLFHKIHDTSKKIVNNCCQGCFLPPNFDELLKAIFDQLYLFSIKKPLLLEAFQLLLLLLPAEKRRRFENLLIYLNTCSTDTKFCLSSEMSNNDYVLHHFKDLLLKCGQLNKIQISRFVDYIVADCRKLFNPPSGFREELFRRQYRQIYTVAEPDPGISYCNRISNDQFEIQKCELSQQALLQLANEVINDSDLDLKQKLDFLDKFKTEYPELYSSIRCRTYWSKFSCTGLSDVRPSPYCVVMPDRRSTTPVLDHRKNVKQVYPGSVAFIANNNGPSNVEKPPIKQKLEKGLTLYPSDEIMSSTNGGAAKKTPADSSAAKVRAQNANQHAAVKRSDVKFAKFEASVSDAWSSSEDFQINPSTAQISADTVLKRYDCLIGSSNSQHGRMNAKAQALQRLATQKEPLPSSASSSAHNSSQKSPASSALYPKLAEFSNETTTSRGNIVDILTAEDAKYNKIVKLLNSPVIDLDELKKECWKGVPHKLRPRAWRIISGYLPPIKANIERVLKKKRDEYFDFVQQYFHTRHDEQHQDTFRQIHIDIPRMCFMPLFQQQCVQEIFERILYMWAIRHPASGYVQGINDLVTPFFVVFLSEFVESTKEVGSLDVSKMPRDQRESIEADSFWCLTLLLDTIHENYTFAQPGIQLKVRMLENLMTRVDNQLHLHLINNQVEYLQFAFRWMNNLLMREIPLRATIRLWDTYLSENNGFADFHVYVCAAFLRMWSKQIRQERDFQNVMILLQNLPTHSWSDQQMAELTADAYSLMSLFAGSKNHLQYLKKNNPSDNIMYNNQTAARR
uniref:Rab-GAP TBC domain-containing protein n=1 Tax=Romanomermis culicivorax TaxID=13658 RepID=A0A915HJA9_ROMCU